MVTIKSKKEIEYMKEACRVVAVMYEELEKKIGQLIKYSTKESNLLEKKEENKNKIIKIKK